MFVGHAAGADLGASAWTALVVMDARLLYSVCYIADLAALRSLIFAVGLGGCVWLFLLAACCSVIRTGPYAPSTTILGLAVQGERDVSLQGASVSICSRERMRASTAAGTGGDVVPVRSLISGARL